MKKLAKKLILPTLDRVRSIVRKGQLKSELSRITKAELVRDLEQMPLGVKAAVLVHSSLKNLGYVEGGPNTVIEALIQVVVDKNAGTLVFPTFSINGTMYNSLANPEIFDVRETKSNLGAIPESFRKFPGAIRSVHPTHSFAAIGQEAEWFVKDHHLCGSTFGVGSPMQKLMERDGMLVGLGTNIGNVTFYHCLEDCNPGFPVDVYSDDSPFSVDCVDWDGCKHQLSLPAHKPGISRHRIDHKDSQALRAFYEERFRAKAGLSFTPVGSTRAWSVSMRSIYQETENLMKAGITIYSGKHDLSKLRELAEGNRDG